MSEIQESNTEDEVLAMASRERTVKRPRSRNGRAFPSGAAFCGHGQLLSFTLLALFLLARYGGEEFAVLLPNTGIRGASRLAETMKSRVQNLSVIHPDSDVGNRLTVSIGVAAMIPQHNDSQFDLIKAADDALYMAKREGRNCVRTSSASMRTRESQSSRGYVA